MQDNKKLILVDHFGSELNCICITRFLAMTTVKPEYIKITSSGNNLLCFYAILIGNLGSIWLSITINDYQG